MSKRRVVITGLGAVTPVGNTVADTWKSIKAGVCGIDKITLFDSGDLAVRIAAEVKDFNPADHGVDRRDARKMGRYAQFAAAAAHQAITDAGFPEGEGETPSPPCGIGAAKSGVILGNGIGGFEILEAAYQKYFQVARDRIPPLSIPMLIPNEASANICMRYGIQGASWTIVTACASGTDALGAALDLVRSGRLDVCVAGGTESTITGFGISSFIALQTLAGSFNDDPQKASRPFDKRREGFVMGEGAGILILEELEHAKKRGAKIYAEFTGYGFSNDGYHITSPRPDGSGGALAITRALEDAGIEAADVDYYNAHGTSTPINDPAETRMIKLAFGSHAGKLKISSTKSMTGHCVGAAGAIEAIIGIKALEDDFYPPTINLDEPDLEAGCDLDYVPNKGVSAPLNCFASASLGFGGHNSCVIMKKYTA